MRNDKNAALFDLIVNLAAFSLLVLAMLVVFGLASPARAACTSFGPVLCIPMDQCERVNGICQEKATDGYPPAPEGGVTEDMWCRLMGDLVEEQFFLEFGCDVVDGPLTAKDWCRFIWQASGQNMAAYCEYGCCVAVTPDPPQPVPPGPDNPPPVKCAADEVNEKGVCVPLCPYEAVALERDPEPIIDMPWGGNATMLAVPPGNCCSQGPCTEIASSTEAVRITIPEGWNSFRLSAGTRDFLEGHDMDMIVQRGKVPSCSLHPYHPSSPFPNRLSLYDPSANLWASNDVFWNITRGTVDGGSTEAIAVSPGQGVSVWPGDVFFARFCNVSNHRAAFQLGATQ